MGDGMQLLLASQSPRRREMIAWLGVPVVLTSASIVEEPFRGEHPSAMAPRLAKRKAMSLCRDPRGAGKGDDASASLFAQAEVWVLAADTVVDFEGTALGKPHNPQEAVDMLRRLRGRWHDVHTGVVLCHPATGRIMMRRVTTVVRMRDYTDREIATYVASGDPLDKAGAYAIQHLDFHPVVGIDRCYANVVGLPLCAVVEMLSAVGFSLSIAVPELCFQHFAYHCPAPDVGDEV